MWTLVPLSQRVRSRGLNRFLGPERLEGRVVPAAILVSSLGNAGLGSLRAAITQADADTTPDTIMFAPTVTGTITLLSALPDLSAAITIDGPGSSVLTVARSAAPGTPDFRIFTVPARAEVRITGLTLSGGDAGAGEGGGISNAGALTVTNSTLSGNAADRGGGIFSSGALTVTNSTLSGNAVFEQGANGGGLGGGIFSSGALTVTNTTFSGNSASGVLSISGDATTGGGIYGTGTMTITNSLFSRNAADAGGGIAVLNGGTLTVTNSTFIENFANYGGGIDDFGQVTVTDSTFNDNSSDYGGGIEVTGTLTVTASLFANPVVSGWEHHIGSNINIETGSTFVSLGHNLFTDKPAAPLSPTDLVNTDPLLAPLGDYGGPTQTMALLPGSPAIDAGVPVVGVTTDQRGVARPQGSAPDIGAFEARRFTLSIVAGGGQRAPTGSIFPVPLTVSVTSAYGEPVAGGRVTFSTPSSGPSAQIAITPVTIGADGQAGTLASANSLGGTYAVTAGAAGAGGVALIETNVGPGVVNLQRTGIHLQPTRLVLTFDRPMNTATAQDLRNYSLYPIGPNGYGGPHPKPIPIVTAVYNTATRSVTLTPQTRLTLSGYYLLTVSGVGPHPVRDLDGNPFTGTGTGGRAGDYIALVHGYGPWYPAAPAAQVVKATAVPAGPRLQPLRVVRP